MKAGGYFEQCLPHQKKRKPEDEYSGHDLSRTYERRQKPAF